MEIVGTKKEKHRESRKKRKVKLYSAGARCMFSILPLSLVKDNIEELL
jgi:hypothetical protein